MSVSTATTLMLLDSRVRPGTVTLPLTTTIPGRTLTLKDSTGAAGVSTVTISTSGGEMFEDGNTIKTLTTAYGSLTLTGNGGKWYITPQTFTGAINSISTGQLKAAAITNLTTVATPTTISDYLVYDCGVGPVFTNRPTSVVVDPSTGNAYIGELFGAIRVLSPAGVLSAFVGTYNASTFADGVGTNAYFKDVVGMVLDGKGNMYVCDRGNNRIRKVVMSTATVSTFAGSGVASSVDGVGTSATLNWPRCITIDPTGTYLYIGEEVGSYVRRITIATGLVTTIAGNGSTAASTDGVGSSAAFQGIQGIIIDPTGTTLYACDTGGHKIRKIVLSTATVSTFAGSGAGTDVDGTGTNAALAQPVGITINPSGTTLYVGEGSGCLIRTISIATGTVLTLAGVSGSQSYADGLASSGTVRFGSIQSLFVDTTGTIWAGDYFPSTRVRKITPIYANTSLLTTTSNLAINAGTLTGATSLNNIALSPMTGIVTTFAGSGTNASTDGIGTNASFGPIRASAYDPNTGNLYVCDNVYRIRQVTSSGVVTTLAGNGNTTSTDGTGTNASFNQAYGLCVDPTGTYVYVAEQGGNKVRRIVVATGVVTTIAGSGSAADTDGTGTNAAFNSAMSVAADPFGNLYVTTTYKVRRINLSNNVVTTVAGSGSSAYTDGAGTSASFFGAVIGSVCDQSGNLYVCDGTKVRKVTFAGVVTTIAGTASQLYLDGTGTNASFYQLQQLTIDPTGTLYVSDGGNTTGTNYIRMITPAGVVTTLAGNGTNTDVDGTGAGASFKILTGLSYGQPSVLWAVDQGCKVRKVTLVASVGGVFLNSGTAQAPTVSTLALNISSINGTVPWTTPNFTSTVIGLTTNIAAMIDTTELTSTVVGLGTAGFASTLGVTSTVAGLGQTYVSIASLRASISTINVSAATVQAGQLSSLQLFVSSINGQTYGSFTGSTIYLSASQIQATTGYISSLTVDSIALGSNAAFFTMGDVLATSLSTFQVNTGILYMNSTFIGNASSLTALQFYGNAGAYNQTALAEVSTGSGIQEFLIFRGSSASDRIRMQTTGTIVFEPGVSSRLWPAAPSNATPAMVINTASNVGIQTATPAFPLDVAGTTRAQTLSTLALNVCTINGFIPWQPIYLQSTVQGLGTTGYVSTASLTATLTSTVAGLGQTYASTASLKASISTIYLSAATIQAGQLSSLQLFVSSINGAIPGTGSGGTTFVGSTIFVSAATIQTSTLSTFTFQANNGYVSSLTVDSLQIGSNAAYINLGDTIATSISTVLVRAGIANVTSLAATSTLLGYSSLQTAVQFYGLTGNYTNTVLAEQSTSATSQEFVVFRGSSASDRIRLQTTGNIVFEPGVTQRLWPNTPSNVTPALIINSSSNIGILTATPTVPLDVAGIGRFQMLSTLNLQVCTINGAAPGTGSGSGTTFVGSTIFLSSAQGFISSLTVNALTIGVTAGFTVMGDVIAASLSTINLNVSTINGAIPGSGSGGASAFNGSTIAMSTLQLFDPALTFSSLGNVYVRSSILYYNSTIVAGARQVQPQMFTF